ASPRRWRGRWSARLPRFHPPPARLYGDRQRGVRALRGQLPPARPLSGGRRVRDRPREPVLLRAGRPGVEQPRLPPRRAERVHDRPLLDQPRQRREAPALEEVALHSLTDQRVGARRTSSGSTCPSCTVTGARRSASFSCQTRTWYVPAGTPAMV